MAQSDNGFGKLIKVLVVVWTLFCGYAAYSGLALNPAVAKYTPLGAAVGATVRLGAILIMWIVPVIGSLVLYRKFGMRN